jgi:hypothetical protein
VRRLRIGAGTGCTGGHGKARAIEPAHQGFAVDAVAGKVTGIRQPLGGGAGEYRRALRHEACFKFGAQGQ